MKKILLLLFLCQVVVCKAKIYDCFTFFNELELLEVRLEELYDVVDHFVLVEARVTFSGNPKPLFFAENAHQFQKYQDKIIHIVVDTIPIPEGNIEKYNWARQEYQRNAILWGLADCQDDDIIMISDLDEIPNLRAIADIKKHFEKNTIHSTTDLNKLICELHMRLFMFYLDWESDRIWAGAMKATPYLIAKRILPNSLRILHHSNHNLFKIFDAGWHFNTMGGRERVIEKRRSVSTGYLIPEGYFDNFDFERYLEEIAKAYGLKVVLVDDSYPKSILNNYEYFQTIGWFKECQ